eukprot:g21647.t1
MCTETLCARNDKPTQELLLPKVVNGTAGDWFAALDASFEVERMAVGASHGHVYLMDMAIFKPVLDLLGHRAFVRRVIADWAQQRVASCSSDGYLNVYDTRSGTAIWELPHDRCCDAMDVSFDAGLALERRRGKVAATTSARAESRDERTCFVLHLRTGRTVKEFAIPGHKPSWMKVNWDTQIVCTGADDKVKFWDLETGEVSKTIDCHHHLTQAHCSLCPVAGQLITAHFDRFVLLPVCSNDWATGEPCALFDVNPSARGLTLRPAADRLRLGLERLFRHPETGRLHAQLSETGSVPLSSLLRYFGQRLLGGVRFSPQQALEALSSSKDQSLGGSQDFDRARARVAQVQPVNAAQNSGSASEQREVDPSRC